ncbi:pre-mRNA-processing ATP-dependent RNA helicaseprp5 [Striga asiatica]|uniref:Pre-mRNA-processing ATP-dependent RNA helicaseprp5 n=1 Tax=Striga asiatica TaxID=4170 RepID=A0A5A7PEK0_STRAF|nr:pre-mRNA-processing ATP-dependent RNA helicaseprp5 [Striga asiatica]
MHRKLMQNSTEPLKNDSTDQRSTNAFEPANEPFDFLSIGTFGTDLLLHTAPPTPTLLPTPVEPLTGQPIDINENDLDLISQELEKFLESEDAETVHNSSERSSKASVITINDQGNLQICPLQKYLLAAPVELAEMGREEVKKTRTSLEELFKEGNDGPLLKKGEGVGGKGNVARLVKKFVKRLSHKSSDGTAGFNDDDDYDGAVFRPTKKKLTKKLVKMFNKKVYPEEMAEKQILKVTKSNEKKNYNCSKENHLIGHNNDDQSASINKSKKNTIGLFCTGFGRGSSPVNAGHWVKTDSDYLVLEL